MKRPLLKSEAEILARKLADWHSHATWSNIFDDAKLSEYDPREGSRWARVTEVLQLAQEGGVPTPLRRLLSIASRPGVFESADTFESYRADLNPPLQIYGLEVTPTGDVVGLGDDDSPPSRARQGGEISVVTRRRLRKLISGLDPGWWGELAEIDFLSRLYDLEDLPSTDSRFPTASEDILQHRVRNEDWDDDWPLEDKRFAGASDKSLLGFLAQVVHPGVRDDGKRVAAELNALINLDGWSLVESGRISGEPVYRVEPCAPPSRSKFGELTDGMIVGGRYQVLEFMIEGGFGRIYRVWDKATKAEVVLKECPPDAAEGDTQRFVREVEAMQSVTHRNVMTVLDAGDHNSVPYFVMPLAKGDLSEVADDLRRQGKVVEAMLEICEGVQAIHDAGHVHRDLKPGNILRLDGRWTVSDLGLTAHAEPSGDTTRLTSSAVGTEGYIAPELLVANQRIQPTHGSDVFSLGVILYFLLTGRSSTYGNVSKLPLVLGTIVARATDHDPNKRYRSARELLEDLRRAEKSESRAKEENFEQSPISLQKVRTFADRFAKMNAEERMRDFDALKGETLIQMVDVDPDGVARVLEGFRDALERDCDRRAYGYAETVSARMRAIMSHTEHRAARTYAFRCLLVAAVTLRRYSAMDDALNIIEGSTSEDVATAMLLEPSRVRVLADHRELADLRGEVGRAWAFVNAAPN